MRFTATTAGDSVDCAASGSMISIQAGRNAAPTIMMASRPPLIWVRSPAGGTTNSIIAADHRIGAARKATSNQLAIGGSLRRTTSKYIQAI